MSPFLLLAFHCPGTPVNQPRSGLASPLWDPRSCYLLQPLLESHASALVGGTKEGHLHCFSHQTLLLLRPLLVSLSSQNDFHSYSSSRTGAQAPAHIQGFGLGPSNSDSNYYWLKIVLSHSSGLSSASEHWRPYREQPVPVGFLCYCILRIKRKMK